MPDQMTPHQRAAELVKSPEICPWLSLKQEQSLITEVTRALQAQSADDEERHREQQAALRERWEAMHKWDGLISAIRAAAREVGYAIGVHGSLQRDIDLIAAPWTSEAVPAEDLAEVVRKAAEKAGPHGVALLSRTESEEFFQRGMPGAKPHGRLCWSFHLGGGPYIDLSVLTCGMEVVDPLLENRSLRTLLAEALAALKGGK